MKTTNYICDICKTSKSKEDLCQMRVSTNGLKINDGGYYNELNVEKMTAAQELEFYIDRYIDLYKENSDLLNFNANFSIYIGSEDTTKDEMKPYNSIIDKFVNKFHVLYKKAQDDKTVRTDISEKSIFYNVMYAMLSALSKYSSGIIHSADQDINYEKEICQLKDMYLEYYCRK